MLFSRLCFGDLLKGTTTPFLFGPPVYFVKQRDKTTTKQQLYSTIKHQRIISYTKKAAGSFSKASMLLEKATSVYFRPLFFMQLAGIISALSTLFDRSKTWNERFIYDATLRIICITGDALLNVEEGTHWHVSEDVLKVMRNGRIRWIGQGSTTCSRQDVFGFYSARQSISNTFKMDSSARHPKVASCFIFTTKT